MSTTPDRPRLRGCQVNSTTLEPGAAQRCGPFTPLPLGPRPHAKSALGSLKTLPWTHVDGSLASGDAPEGSGQPESELCAFPAPWCGEPPGLWALGSGLWALGREGGEVRVHRVPWSPLSPEPWQRRPFRTEQQSNSDASRVPRTSFDLPQHRVFLILSLCAPSPTSIPALCQPWGGTWVTTAFPGPPVAGRGRGLPGQKSWGAWVAQ